MSKLLPEGSRCGSPVTDSLETEIKQHGKEGYRQKWMYHIQLFDRHIQLEAEAKAHMMAYDKQLKDFTTMYDEEPIV
jgi:hypothetical protein